MKNKFLGFLLLIISIPSLAQNKAWYYVAGLSTASAILYGDFAKNEQQNYYQNNLQSFHSSADDVLQYSPTLINLGLHVAGLKDNQKPKELIAVFLIGTGTYTVMTQGLKYAINETRPDGTDHSFPSGHTATAFFGARMLDRSFGKQYPLISVGGYALATATGALRIANNKHWATDVAMGAAIGIASAEIAHWIYPKLKKSLDKTSLNWEPIVAPNYYAARVSYAF
ncbi:phosphatase PAP2 family protein [Aquirufa sp. TARAVU-A1A]